MLEILWQFFGLSRTLPHVALDIAVILAGVWFVGFLLLPLKMPRKLNRR